MEGQQRRCCFRTPRLAARTQDLRPTTFHAEENRADQGEIQTVQPPAGRGHCIGGTIGAIYTKHSSGHEEQVRCIDPAWFGGVFAGVKGAFSVGKSSLSIQKYALTSRRRRRRIYFVSNTSKTPLPLLFINTSSSSPICFCSLQVKR